ncbi:squamosa promoter-binding-like protein 1 [Euphorbia lathyris]|uniref:squamosa promoter-binding-like protein 1 n=1 Tax=Euphorbia lathyris TaxID=212925 RepID=UPI0033138413
MEAKVTGKSHLFYGKKSLDWDLNDWRWDGDLFTASSLNTVQSDCRSRQFFPVRPEIPVTGGTSNGSISELGKRELEKRRRDVIGEDEDVIGEAATLNLKLGDQDYPIMDEDGKSGKKIKFIGSSSSSNRLVCQVEDCRVDLSNAKDYHRRHKVCSVHSKASKALVGNVMQRFCQQCSRFHLLQEFDEGKRSCRRRLAGHNQRRRKTHPENVGNGSSSNDEKGSSYLLISLLRILSNLHSNTSDQAKDQDLLSHLLRNLANPAGTSNGANATGLLQGPETTTGTPEKVPDMIRNSSICAGPSTSTSKKDDSPISKDIVRPSSQCGAARGSDFTQNRIFNNNGHCVAPQAIPSPECNLPVKVNETRFGIERIMCSNIDLNSVYDGSQDCVVNIEKSPAPLHTGKGSVTCPLWMQSDFRKKSPSQTSGNSDSTSSLSPSSSSGEAQSRTDRIVFKLFGKDPNDFPLALRTQILDWLSHSPTDIESYIRPGCIILTVYLRLEKPQWEQIRLDLGSSLSRLLGASADPFWRSGWVYARVQHCVSFIYNGQVVLNTPVPVERNRSCKILSIKPIAVTLSEQAQFVVKGYNICRPTTRLLCALEGEYLIQQTSYDLIDGADTITEHDKLQTLSFPCSIPNKTGRGFVEVEDNGLSSSFFPFIVAEKEVCSEICVLEEAIAVTETADKLPEIAERIEAKNQALDFIHEMGWLLHRNRSKLRLGLSDPNSDLFPLKRYRWLLEFSMDRDWCAVVKKLLNILFDGTVDTRGYSSIELPLLDMCLLHRAVHRNSTSMVKLLLKFVPDKPTGQMQKHEVERTNSFIFTPDVVGPAGLTPLHIAASRAGCENILDALTDDPGSVGIEAWTTSRDSTGLTPYDYACLRGYYSYINLIQRKENAHTVLDIPTTLLEGLKSSKIIGMQVEKNKLQQHCKLCEKQKLVYGQRRASLAYRPAILSMVAIAAICVCVALLFKSSPEVLYVFRPFRWEMLKYGVS